MALTLNFRRKDKGTDAESLVTFSGTAELEADKLAIDLQLGFQDLRIRYGLIRTRYFIVGCSGSRVEIRIEGGRIESYSTFAATEVAHDEDRGTEVTITAELAPSIKLSESLEISPGKIGRSKTKSASSNTKYILFEKRIAETLLTNRSGVRWTISNARNKNIIRDHIIDTFDLRSNWSGQAARDGEVGVDNDVMFINGDGNRIKYSWLLSFRAWRQGIRIDGLARSQRTFGFST
jgi:hypothetical protein